MLALNSSEPGSGLSMAGVGNGSGRPEVIRHLVNHPMTERLEVALKPAKAPVTLGWGCHLTCSLATLCGQHQAFLSGVQNDIARRGTQQVLPELCMSRAHHITSTQNLAA